MSDSQSTIARAIIASAYLVAATILLASIGTVLSIDSSPSDAGLVILGVVFIFMVYFFAVGFRLLGRVKRDVGS